MENQPVDWSLLPFLPLSTVRAALQCGEDAWSGLLESGLAPFRIGHNWFVDKSNLANVSAIKARVTEDRPPVASLAPVAPVPSGRTWLTTEQAAEHVGCSIKTICRAIKAGNLPYTKVGSGYRIDRVALEDAIRAGRL